MGGWADLRYAHASAVFSAPGQTSVACSWCANALAKVAVEDFCFGTIINVAVALALTFVLVKIIINIILGRARCLDAVA